MRRNPNRKNKHPVVERRLGLAFFLNILCFPRVLQLLGPTFKICIWEKGCLPMSSQVFRQACAESSFPSQCKMEKIVVERLLKFPDGRFLFPFFCPQIGQPSYFFLAMVIHPWSSFFAFILARSEESKFQLFATGVR